MGFSGAFAKGVTILLLLALASPLAAQEARWKELVQQATTLRAQGKYAEGILVAEEVLRVAESTFGAEDSNLVFSLTMLGVMYTEQGKYSEAEPLYQRSLAILEKTVGPEDPKVATALGNLALLYEEQGKYDEAEQLYQRSLAIYDQALGPDDPDASTSLNNLAELYFDEGKYAEAEPLYRRSLAIDEKALGADDPGVATDLNNLALLYQTLGKYGEAEEFYQRSLAIREKALGPEHPDLAVTLHNLAQLCFLEGKYAEAEPLYQRSLAIDEKVLGADHLDVSLILNDLALLYRTAGKYAEADPLYQRSLAIREKALGPEHPDVASVLNNLGELYFDEGRYSEAGPLFQRSLAIDEKVLGPDHPNVAVNLINLALLYQTQGRYAEAEPLFKRSLAIREKALGPDHPDVGANLNSLAALYDDEGRYAEAEPLYQRSLTIEEKTLGPDHLDVAASLNNLASLYAEQRKYAEAEPLYQRSLAIREKVLGPDHPDVATGLNNLALLYQEQGKYADAKSLFERSLAIDEKVLGPGHRDMATTLNNLALLNYALGNSAEAQVFFDRNLQNLSKEFDSGFTYMSEKDRLQFLSSLRLYFDAYLSFGLTHAQQDTALVGKMYDLLLWEKGMVGTSISALRAQVAASGDAEALQILNHLAEKKSESARLASAHPKDWEQLQKGAEEEANGLEQQLARRVSSLDAQKTLARASWRDIQKKLLPGEAAVEFVRFQFFDGKQWTDTSKYAALIVTGNVKDKPTLISLGDAEELEGDPLRDYRLRVGLRANGSVRGVTVMTPAESAEAAPKVSFYDAFWKPLETALQGVHRIYVSPDGVLNQVALGDVTTGDGYLLMEKYDLRLVSSTKDILRSPRKASSNMAVLVGNPSFDLDEAQQRAALRSLEFAAHATHSATAAEEAATLRSHDLGTERLNPLPGTQAEVNAISALLEKQHWLVRTYTQQNALKESVMEVKSPRVLHLATHGFFESDQQKKVPRSESDPSSGLEDPMLRSGLFFAGADRRLSGHASPADLDDGVLTAYEASELDLQGTELVVLSACETGLGEVTAGEGVFGLRRALQVAGAESVLMSMWAVPDKETQELMALFYGKWMAGKDKHEALREAQSEMRARVKERYGKDLPQYWGAFILVGN